MKNWMQLTTILGVLTFFICGSRLVFAKTAYEAVIRVTDPSTEDHGAWLYGAWDSIKNHALGSKTVSTQVEIPENYQKLDFTVEPSDKPTHIHMHLKNKSQDTYTITSMIEFVSSSVYARAIHGGQIALSFLYRVWVCIVDGITYLVALTKSSLLQIWDYVIYFARILLGVPLQIGSYLASLFGNVCQDVTDGLKLVYGFITDSLYRTFSAFACMLGTIIGFLSGFVQILIKSVAFLLVWVKGLVWSTFAFSNACQHLPRLVEDFLRSCVAYLQYFFQFVCWEFLYELLTLVKATGNLTSRISVPFLAGITMTVFTWLVLYSDSQIPGRFPPTPISPTKFKKLSCHSFHSGYVLAIMNGFLVFVLALWSSV